MITSTAWKDKRYAVLGLARSGRATVEALLASGAKVMAWDSREEARAEFAGRVELADPVEADLTGFAGVVVSPGVPLNTHPIKPHADSFGVPVIGDIELFAQARAELPPHKVVGITGTNGKSTTTALVHHILKTAGVPTTMGGNIGLPILEQEPLPEGGVYVLELSSYQIDLTYSLDCDVAVLLNITPDHLDRYDSFEAYKASKLRLFALQSEGRAAVYNFDSGEGRDVERIRGGDADTHWFTSDRVGLLDSQADWPSLQGPHNALNAAAAIMVCNALGCDGDLIGKALRTYPGLPHRMERIAEISGVAYVNDSKGTNTAASAPALAAFDNIHWILGGLAKEPGLGECEAELGHVKAAYTIGKAGPDFAALLEGRVPVEQCETLDRAVSNAAARAVAGDTVLLSPACASFDQYRDFEERGDHFRELVEGLK
ncbi:UDP-N-acetylmuramoyl-L-alanine--D-glutamate ligase [Qipengyuania sp. 6B39]|uniref:UDP-N-acetylmuramoyl-L-alanine--D-glutamate ligase n=1 Tax=Qipengyuania proteolytica TaxID=2867239 RepID=UPI001C89A118|nr:UDP-N-acetylmuramoyl-L-alanine--D-glutamate ligase [Qipengyuania proteolytica]MBX7496634.1 UDP-N-acetylmuramoyl-L-alanine--D-glutamate ligase [Qipengyuania proteolytica]